jgi:sulfur dioxygenase
MASIEVSLSSTPRRKKNGSLGGINASIRSIPKEIAAKELETLRNALRDKENIIQSLKGQLTIPGLRLSSIRNSTSNSTRDLTEVEKKQAEERLGRLKTDVDNKRLAIKNLKMALERLDITE